MKWVSGVGTRSWSIRFFHVLQFSIELDPTAALPRIRIIKYTYIHRQHMATRTISITEEAYERLKNLKKNEKVSFSDVILEHYPKRRKLSEVLNEIGDSSELADSIEKASREMRKARFREAKV